MKSNTTIQAGYGESPSNVFSRLKEFYEKNGHTLVLKSDDEELAEWCRQIRSDRISGSLSFSKEDLESLENLKFTWDVRRYNWNSKIEELRAFYEKNGHTLVSFRDNADLAKWCSQLRSSRKNGRHRFTEEELKCLANIGFVWDLDAYKWNKAFEELCTFRSIHGHCCVPTSHPTLGNWVRNQKNRYRELLKGKTSGMSPERFEALSAIGFWESFETNADRWNQRFRELTEFYDNFGHSNVPADYAENYQLGQWVMNQRDHFKRYVAGFSSPLSERRIASLESLDFHWNRNSHDWYQMYERLKAFSQKHGSIQIPSEDTANADLRLWLYQQRYQHQRKLENRTSTMSDERQKDLEKIPHLVWRDPASKEGPSVNDWEDLFEGFRKEDVAKVAGVADFWFERSDNLDTRNEDVVDLWNQGDDEDVMDLWNQEED
eukprot:CAMPEP_0178929028 /NCGR_PEP_ID=MMETSP0786-20121207/20299_1 /TAXON_ID=186022 /ORGANISM="Thalassionema frauenfeldii, Strain CCMP 1798" /LENGTH=432 /DNA_ID=CAMNT_0020605093 /DNA_START=153 /DNA_END=1451 /DNA_ORIENTATION=+